MRTRRGMVVGLALALVTATGCQGGDEAAGDGDDGTGSTTDDPASSAGSSTVSSSVAQLPPTTESTSPGSTTSTSSTTSTTTTLPTVPRQPLSGAVRADGEEVVDRPALAVKIDNAPGARRNHSGLSRADIVFEEIVEGSITRFAAVFHSRGSDVVGPIRSGRSQDIDLLTSFDQPLFAWSGGNPGVTRAIAESTLTDLNWQRGGEGYYRGSGSAPHNLYNSTETLWAQTPDDHPGAPPQQFTYVRPEERFTGDPVAGASLALRGIDVDWEWSPDRNRFLRFQEGGPHFDLWHDQQIAAANVVIMVVQYLPSQIDARSPEAQTIGTGPLYVLSAGRVVEGRWFRESADEPIQLLDADGDEIALTPGTTWIELAEAIATDDPANPDADVVITPVDG